MVAAVDSGRETVLPERLAALLRDHRGEPVFRLDDGTVGVADAELMDAVLRSRPANEHERPTFKPLRGRSIGRGEASTLMQAISHDVRTALRRPVEPVDLTGEWPRVAHTYLRDLVFGADPRRFAVLVDRRLEWTPKLTWLVIAAGAGMPGWPDEAAPLSRLGALTAQSRGYRERRHALGMYRRAAAPICFTISTLVGSALWLGAPFAEEVSHRDLLLEALRLLPPSWNMLRLASPEFAALDGRIGASDDVLLLPLLTHRDPARWPEPERFRPQRWANLDPDDTPGYLPFGHANERCWGRHLVLPLAERLLELVRSDGLIVDPAQRSAKVPLAGLLGTTGVRVIRPK